MNTSAPAPRAARAVEQEWRRLATDTPDPEPFDPTTLGDLPAVARRWLVHAIPPGTPLAHCVELRMHGQIRIGAWRPFTATQILSPEGLVWAATATAAGLPITGFDRYSGGTGQMRWRLLGIIPVMSAHGPDVTRSAAGRWAGESVVLLPTAFRAATWTDGPTADTAVASCPTAHGDEHTEVQIDPDGRLVRAVLQRWGNPAGAPYGRYPFGVTVEDEATFAGITIPSVFHAGWFWGTDRQQDGEFFRATITTAQFR